MMTCGRLVAVILLLVIGTAVVSADYKQSFQKGIQASNRKNWPEAIRFLEQALAEQGKETGENIQISGLDFRPYLPHFYLGIARMNVNDCASALKAWQTSETSGVIKRTREYGALVKHRSECTARVGNEGAQATTAAATVQSAPAPVRSFVPPAESTARPPISTPTATQPAASERGTTPAIAPGIEDLSPPVATERVAPAPVVSESTLPSIPPTESKARLGDRPPKELVTAARFLFTAQYQDAVNVLAGVRYDSRPAATQAALLRSAALYALYLLGGEKDKALLDQVSSEIRACKQLDPTLVPSVDAFSPRFIELFRKLS